MTEFEIQLSIRILKTKNNIYDIKNTIQSMDIVHPDREKNEILLHELKAYLSGLEFAQELYFKN